MESLERPITAAAHLGEVGLLIARGATTTDHADDGSAIDRKRSYPGAPRNMSRRQRYTEGNCVVAIVEPKLPFQPEPIGRVPVALGVGGASRAEQTQQISYSFAEVVDPLSSRTEEDLECSGLSASEELDRVDRIGKR